MNYDRLNILNVPGIVAERESIPEFEFTDTELAKELTEFLLEKAIYVHKEKCWYVYDGIRYKEDDCRKIEKLFDEFLSERIKKDFSDGFKQNAHKLGKYRSLKNISKQKNIIDAAIPHVRKGDDILDKDGNLFNVKNGIIKFSESGYEFLEHEPKYTLSFSSPAKYNSEARASKWSEFILKITSDNNGVAEYLQKYFGYCLTSNISDQSFIFLYGVGCNGKSTFLNTLKYIFGDYATNANFTSFTRDRNNNNASSDLARLDKKRIVLTDESISNDGRRSTQKARIDARVLKTITGGDTLIVRRLYKEEENIEPGCKIILYGNNQLEFNDLSYGMQRRVRQIPFLHQFTNPRKMEDVLAEFHSEASGILNWLLAGYKKYLAEGLEIPQIIADSTEELFLSQSDVLQFIKDTCERNDNSSIEGKELFNAYINYCDENTIEKIGRKRFYSDIESFGFLKRKNMNSKLQHFVGLQLKN